MGLSMRLNLFHQVTPEEVYAAIGSFYRQPFHVLAVLDFLRYLGVGIELTDGWFEFSAPVWRSFWVSRQNMKELWKEKYRR